MEQRLIDANKLKAHYAWWNDQNKSLFDCKGLIESCPTVNAVEVIRCQKCRHWKQHTAVDSEGNLVYLDSGNCGIRETNKDDYCSFAVRREDDEQRND